MKASRLAIAAALTVASLALPAAADHCSKVIIFSGLAGRGVNAGVVGCTTPFGHEGTNWMTPGAPGAIVGWTGSKHGPPAGSLTVNGKTVNLTRPKWDPMRQYWTFDEVSLKPGPATLTATVYPQSDPTKTESVTYSKGF